MVELGVREWNIIFGCVGLCIIYVIGEEFGLVVYLKIWNFFRFYVGYFLILRYFVWRFFMKFVEYEEWNVVVLL